MAASEGALKSARLVFIGSGTMAGAIMRALLRKGEVDPGRMIASDPRGERREELKEALNVRTTDDNGQAVRGADIVVLSVKPQVLSYVLAELHGQIPSSALVLSIVAGAPIAAIREGLSHRAIVRTMPNTPAQIGEGMTVWTATKEVTERQRAQARTLLNAMGIQLYVEKEDALNMATAVSGSGPGFVFLLLEALVDGAVRLGFSRSQARMLVLQTVSGSVEFARQSDLHLAELRNMVTSPGGTTAEGLYAMEQGRVRAVLAETLWAAYAKSRQLGGSPEE